MKSQEISSVAIDSLEKVVKVWTKNKNINSKMYSYLIFGVVLLNIGFGSCQDELEYPCPTLDKECIVNYFNDHAFSYRGNHKVKGCCPLPYSKPKNGLLVKRSEIYLPVLNCTVIRHNISAVDAMNAEITAFFVDRENDYTILTLTYKNFIVTIDKAEVIYYRTAKSPIFTSVNSTTLLERLDLTVYFNGVSKINLFDSLTHAAVSGKNSMTRTTPAYDSYLGTEFEPLFSTVVNNYAGYVQELEAPPQALAFSAFYLQNNICNFDLDTKEEDFFFK